MGTHDLENWEERDTSKNTCHRQRRIVGTFLPVFHRMADDNVEDVINAVRKVVGCVTE